MTTHYVVREKWPRCKKWESYKAFDTFEAANEYFQALTYREPDDGYVIRGAPKGKITVQLVEVTVILEQTK